MLLSQFVAGDGMLRVYAKNGKMRSGHLANECVERDYFEFTYLDRPTNNAYENLLSNIESIAAGMLRRIRNKEHLTQEDANNWAIFVASLFARSRKVREQVGSSMFAAARLHSINPDFIRDIQLDLLNRGELHHADDIQRRITETVKAMQDSAHYFFISGLPNRIKMIATDILARDWHTIDAPDSHRFLFSDCPVVTYEVQNGRLHLGSGFGNQGTIVLLPVSPSKLLVASPKGGRWPSIFTVSDMETVNRLIVQFAHQNVYADFESNDVQNLVNQQINSIQFGTNAFVPPQGSFTSRILGQS